MFSNQVIFIGLAMGAGDPSWGISDDEREPISEMRNPETGECTQFATLEEVPEGWLPCIPCFHQGRLHVSGASLYAEDGCNICQCSDGLLGCTKMFCGGASVESKSHGASSCSAMEKSQCAQTVGCTWLIPGCGDSAVAFAPGCYTNESCKGDSDCEDNETCETISFDPCIGGSGDVVCSACGMLRTACLPASDDNICDLTCEFGFKQDLEGREYCECRTAEACIQMLSVPHKDPESEECVGFPTPCDIPNKWEPCAVQAANGCLKDADCPAGSTCIDDDQKSACEPMSCDYPEDCPSGSSCVGSSVCPRGVLCFWEGEPGVCETDKDVARSPATER